MFIYYISTWLTDLIHVLYWKGYATKRMSYITEDITHIQVQHHTSTVTTSH